MLPRADVIIMMTCQGGKGRCWFEEVVGEVAARVVHAREEVGGEAVEVVVFS